MGITSPRMAFRALCKLIFGDLQLRQTEFYGTFVDTAAEYVLILNRQEVRGFGTALHSSSYLGVYNFASQSSMASASISKLRMSRFRIQRSRICRERGSMQACVWGFITSSAMFQYRICRHLSPGCHVFIWVEVRQVQHFKCRREHRTCQHCGSSPWI